MDYPKDNSENSAEDTVSTQFTEDPFDPLGKDHFIMEVLGEGNFSQVVKCYNSKTDTLEAVKILKSCSDVITLADQEIRILKRLQSLDPDKCHVIKFNNFFFDKEGICLSFELLDLDLFTYIHDVKETPLNSGLALSEVRAIIHQLATALHHLKSIGIIHGDIKPNNIMVVNRQEGSVKVKLADFGTAQIRGNINAESFVSTKCFSPPEILLKCPFDEAVDMWSLGLTAVVAALGTDFIKCTNNTYDILKFIIKMMGQPPDHVLDNGSRTQTFFNEDINMNPKWTIKAAEQYEHETGTTTTKNVPVDNVTHFDNLKDEIVFKQGHQTGLDLFLDLIQKMLHVDPEKRIMPLEVLLHSFFAATEAEPEKDLGLSEPLSCLAIEEEEEVQFRTDLDANVDSLNIQAIESTADKSENITEDSVSPLNNEYLFDPLGKDHLIMEVLGEGNFAPVVKCYNSKTDTIEAVKILKSCSDVITLADQEIRILKRLQSLDPDKCHVVKFNNFFFDKEGICLSFEFLDLDLFTYIYDVKETPLNSGLALSEVRAIIHQLATALHHLKSIGIIHGDIKPNNIMVVNRQEGPVKVKLADFGTAQFRGNINSESFVSTKCYSPPEILLKCPFDEAVDMWSLGLTAVVAALGPDFIPCNNTYDILKFIIKMMGQPPDHVLDNGGTTHIYFNEDIKVNPKWTIKTVGQYEHETGTTTLKNLGELTSLNDIKDEIILKQGNEAGLDLFLDLIQKMLHVDPEKRIMPLEVLLHSFFAATETEAEKDLEVNEPLSCFHIEEEKEDQHINDFHTSMMDSPHFWPTESTEDNSESFPEDTVSTQKKENLFNQLGKHHLIMEVLGEGNFAKVVKCYNSQTDSLEAVKILKSRSDVITLADQEIRILKRLQSLDPDKCHVVKFNNFFFDKEGICLSFELLDLDLLTYIHDVKDTQLNSGLALSEVRAIIHQLATALHHLKSIGIIHGDIKPNNIMVVNRQEGPVKVKLADFGTAQICGDINPNTFANTKCYSPPEILVKCPFDEAVDMWSLGLTAVVAALGTDFIPCNNTYDILKFIIKMMGQPPDHVLDNGSRTRIYFNEDKKMNPKWTIKTVGQYEHETGTTTLKNLGELTSLNYIKDEIILKKGNETGLDLFLDLIQKMLHVDPEKRIMPLEVLLHSFFAVTEAEAEKDLEVNEESFCFRIEEEQEDQFRTDFDMSVTESQSIEPFDSSEDNSEDSEEDSVSPLNNEYLFDPLGKDHLVMEVLGEGTFAQVIKCYNSKTDTLEAVKILKSCPDVITLADQEIRILKRLQSLDPDKCHIVKFNNFFFDKEGICLSFELLDLDLFTYIHDVKDTQLNSGLALSEVRAIIHQLATALHHLKSIGIIHGDIKPNNIMVVNCQEGPVKVKLADFGGAQFCGNINSDTVVNTKCYSPPEILLKCPSTEAVDMWSLGLTAVVAALGTDFIQYNNNTFGILKFIIKMMGQPPDHVLDKGRRTRAFFNEDINMNPKWTLKTVEQYEHETGTTTLKYLDELTSFNDIKDKIIFQRGHQTGLDLFLDLIQKMLDVDPEKRIMPLDVLQHSFFAVREAEADKDLELSDPSSCFTTEKEQQDQHMNKNDLTKDSQSNQCNRDPKNTCLEDQLNIQQTESTKDTSKNVVVHQSQLDVLLDLIQEKFPFHFQNLNKTQHFTNL